jgi:type VI secretion system secreted protein Hcp
MIRTTTAAEAAEHREVHVRIRYGLMAWTAAVALAGVPATALAAVDAFIWFDAVKGDTKDTAHKGAFEIKDFSFDVAGTPTLGSATGGAGAGKVKFNEFTIKRTVDRASPGFFQSMTPGQHYSKVVLEMRKAGGVSSQKTYLQYKFTNVFTTKIDWSGPGDEGPEESVTFSYGAMQLNYLAQPETAGQASSTSVGFPPPGAGQHNPPSTGAVGMPPPGPQPH